MSGLLILLVVVGTIIWVAVDAPRRQWPNGSYTATWVVGCVLLWIVVFPIYLFKRSKTVPKSAVSPTASAQPVAYRECPHCKEAMRRDASVCPHCRHDSPAWRWHDGRWWVRAEGDERWRWLDERSGTWTLLEQPPNAAAAATQ